MPFISKCTNEVIAAVAKQVEAGLPFRDSCALAGISRKCGYEWLEAAERDPEGHPAYVDFADALALARAKFKLECLGAVKAGSSGWQSKAWLLERLFPADFGSDRSLVRAVLKELAKTKQAEDPDASPLDANPAVMAAETDPDGMDDEHVGNAEWDDR
jgi:hypothetical protein